MQDNRLSIRPLLNLTSEIEEENFQNVTLRPILKLQNELILNLFKQFCKKQKLDLNTIKKNQFLEEVLKIIKKNLVLRNQLIGIILGQFTQDEFKIYTENETEFNKRILNMIGQRIFDNQF